MKFISVKVKPPIQTVLAKTDHPQTVWKKDRRILVRTAEGIMIGTVLRVKDSLEIRFDNGSHCELPVNAQSILGEGINRKRKTAIPDEELYQWRRELATDFIKAINTEKSTVDHPEE